MRIRTRTSVAGFALALAVLVTTAGGAAGASGTIDNTRARHLCSGASRDLGSTLTRTVNRPVTYWVRFERAVSTLKQARAQAAGQNAGATITDCIDGLNVFTRAVWSSESPTFDRALAAYTGSGRQHVRAVGRAFVHDMAIAGGAALDETESRERAQLTELRGRVTAPQWATIENYIRVGMNVAAHTRAAGS